MSQYVQRYPKRPKATLWKRYTGTASLGKRVIYLATQTLGFEVDGIPQAFKPRVLVGGVFNCKDQVEYINITSPTKAVSLNQRLYVYNAETQAMEEHDIVDSNMEILTATTSDVIRFEKNAYVRQGEFDCAKEEDQQSSSYQPIQGLTTEATYQTLKTHNFNGGRIEPEHEDLIYYQKRFWIVEETRKTYTYTPKEKTTLHLSIKALGK